MAAAIQYLIDNLPKVLVYLISGYIFLFVYKFVRNVDEQGEDSSKSILPSIAISFIIKLLYDYTIYLYDIALVENSLGYIIILILISALLGYVIGILLNIKGVNNFLSHLSVYRSINNSFWIDICDPTSIYEIHIQGEENSYIGQIQEIEYSKTKPMIHLYHYAVINYKTREIIADLRYDDNATIAVNTQNIDVVHILDCQQIHKEQQGSMDQ